MNKKVYILMATYNREKYLKREIDFIWDQTYKNWKFIVHDNNSKDNTFKIIKEYKYSNKIELLDDEFDYIMFSEREDICLEDKIELILNKMVETKKKYSNKLIILIHIDLKIVDKNLNIIIIFLFTPFIVYLVNENYQVNILLNLKIMSIIIFIGGLNYHYRILEHKKDFSKEIVITSVTNIFFIFFLKYLEVNLSLIIIMYFIKNKKETYYMKYILLLIPTEGVFYYLGLPIQVLPLINIVTILYLFILIITRINYFFYKNIIK